MTSNSLLCGRPFTPFLFHFAKAVPKLSYPPLRYDAARQVSQAFVGGEWRDALDSGIEIVRNTTHTAVTHETLDDK
jgi:hypothetical protein